MIDYRVSLVYVSLALMLIRMTVSVYAYEDFPKGVKRISADCVWDKDGDKTVDPGANAGQGVTIAVIDYGVDYWVDGEGVKHYHPDLNENIIGGMGFRYNGVEVEEMSDYSDFAYDGHGTHVTGTIAAMANGYGVIGTAPKVNILSLKIYSANWGNRTYAAREIAAAIDYAVYRSNLISISLGFQLSEPDEALDAACHNAWDHNMLIFAASGNDNRNEIDYPANCGTVIAVGAIDQDQNDTRWVETPTYGSNYGVKLELAAPGVNINSTVRNGQYGIMKGTSQAVPHVAAAAALLWTSYPYLQNWEVLYELENKSLDLPPAGRDNDTGYGLVNAYYPSQKPIGNININGDLTVDIFDMVTVAIAFSSEPGDPNWCAVADINIDRLIDINDIVVVALHFGEVN